MTTWKDHVLKWCDCQECPLSEQRENIVLARGTIPCDVLFVGEAPGDSENLIGQPFVGPAGFVLDRIVAAAKAQANARVLTTAYTNLVACFPKLAKEAGDNEPTRLEIDACRDRLEEFISIARPRLVVAVGKLAEDNLPLAVRAGGTVEKHATVDRWTSITHPAAILRMPLAQRDMAVQRCVVILSSAMEYLL